MFVLHEIKSLKSACIFFSPLPSLFCFSSLSLLLLLLLLLLLCLSCLLSDHSFCCCSLVLDLLCIGMESCDKATSSSSRKRERDNLQKELEQVQKQLRQAEAENKKLRTQKEQYIYTMCFICQEQTKNPLLICKNNHFACADCCAQSLSARYSLVSNYDADDNPCTFFKVPMEMECFCKSAKMIPTYPGALACILDPAIPEICNQCNAKLTQATSGQHKLICPQNKVMCHSCKQFIPEISITEHTRVTHGIRCRYCPFQHPHIRTHVKKHNVYRALCPLIASMMTHYSTCEDSVVRKNVNMITLFRSIASMFLEKPVEDYSLKLVIGEVREKLYNLNATESKIPYPFLADAWNYENVLYRDELSPLPSISASSRTVIAFSFVFYLMFI